MAVEASQQVRLDTNERLVSRRGGLWLFGVACVVFLVETCLFRRFFMDDAYISFRFVRQLVHGNGLVYNVGERVEGYSNFLWVMLLTPFELVGIDLVPVSKALGVLLGLLTLWLSGRICRRVSGVGVAPLFLAATAAFALSAQSGLETSLFTFLLLASACAFVSEEQTGRGVWSGVLFGLLALTRPEGLLFAVIAAGYRGWVLLRAGSPVRRNDISRPIALAVILVPYLVWKLTYYGALIPNTVYAKSLGLHPRAVLEGLWYLYQSFGTVGGFFVLGLPVVLLLAAGRPRLWADYIMLNLLVYGAAVAAGGGDWMPTQRFAVHVLPLAYLLVEMGIATLATLLRPGLWGRLLLALLICGQAAYLCAGFAEQRFIVGLGSHEPVPPSPEQVAYLQEHVRPGDTIAVAEAGRISYRLPLDVRIIDMVGLTDAHIAHLPARLPGGLFGRGDAFGRWDVDYVLAQRPRFIEVSIVSESSDGRVLTQFTGATLLVNDPEFRRRYRPVRDPAVRGLYVLQDENDVTATGS